MSDVASFSDVRNIMQTVTVGVDWKPRKHTTGYLRYNLLDFDDKTNSANSGFLNMFLGGVCVTW